MGAPIDEKVIFNQSVKHGARIFYCFPPHDLYIIKQIKRPKSCIT